MGHSCELIDSSLYEEDPSLIIALMRTNKQADLGCSMEVHVCPIAKGYLLQINIKKN